MSGYQWKYLSRASRGAWRATGRFGAVLGLLLTIAAGAAASDEALRVHVRFDQVYKLKAGDRVVQGTQPIGFVARLVYLSEGYFEVTLSVDGNLAANLTEYSRFLIVEDPLLEDQRAVRVIQIRKGGKPLQNGQTLAGSDKYSVLLDDMKGNLQDGVEFLTRGMNEFSEELKHLSENERVQALKREIEGLAKAMEGATQETRQKIEKEIVPLLKREMERLREQLRKFGREDEMAPLDDEMKKITRV